MNRINITGRVVSIQKRDTANDSVVNCFLQEYIGGKSLTYQVSFWRESARYFQANVEKNDDIEVSGYIYQIKDSPRGSYLEIRNCELKSIEKRRKIAVEDEQSLRQQSEPMKDQTAEEG